MSEERRADDRAPTPIGLAVASRIDAEMARRKMTQRSLAYRAGVSEGTIRNVLRGLNTSLDTLASIAAGLRVDLADLLRDRAA